MHQQSLAMLEASPAFWRVLRHTLPSAASKNTRARHTTSIQQFSNVVGAHECIFISTLPVFQCSPMLLVL